MEAAVTEVLPIDALPEAPRYFPIERGRYEVKPGLYPLGKDFGNGVWDQRVFQIDGNYTCYYHAKQLARRECLKKYYQTQEFAPEIERSIAQFITERLVQEYPQHYQITQQANGRIWHNRLTGEAVYFDADYRLLDVTGLPPEVPPYCSALDALACQVQEDMAVVSRAGERHWLSAIHLCFPNHWAAAAKIGREFAEVHGPVPGMAGINRRGHALVHTMITQPPLVRFAWGVSTDTRLNHHPEPPPGVDPEQWQGRRFQPHDPRLYLRIERQVIWGFPAVEAALFTIRTYFLDVEVMKKQFPGHCAQLRAAIQSMSPAALDYKGLAHHWSEILAWLDTPISQ
ncbi:heme-dependent oxidative N-demethylase family protein [Gloeomargarita sp.]